PHLLVLPETVVRFTRAAPPRGPGGGEDLRQTPSVPGRVRRAAHVVHPVPVVLPPHHLPAPGSAHHARPRRVDPCAHGPPHPRRRGDPQRDRDRPHLLPLLHPRPLPRATARAALSAAVLPVPDGQAPGEVRVDAVAAHAPVAFPP